MEAPKTLAKLKELYSENTTATPPPTASLFSRNLSLGTRGEDVLRLQKLFIRLGFFPADYKTTYFFGKLTEEATRKFQTYYHIEATGTVGSVTREKIQEIQTASSSLPSTLPTPKPTTLTTLNRQLVPGSKGEDVRFLQEFLVEQGFFPADYKRTDFFGKITESAIKEFQTKYGIVATGIVGTTTIEKIQSLSSTKTQ